MSHTAKTASTPFLLFLGLFFGYRSVYKDMKRYIGLGVGSSYTYHIPPNLLQISVGSVTSPGQVLLSVVSNN